jgi:two-component sensor histidine kinase
MTVFNPAKALADVTNSKFPLVVTRLAIYDGAQKKFVSRATGAAAPSKIDLQPFDRFFELDVAILNYAEPEGHQFSYYLENFDDNWIDNGRKTTVRYTNLPAGNYTLHLKGRDQRGVWTDEILIPVIVHQVFYKKAWFWILCAALVFLVTFLIYRFRIEQLSQLHNVRMKIAADLHDEVGSTLTDIAVQAELAQMEGRADQAATLEKITLKLQEAVGSMRDVIWTVNARNDTAAKLLEHIESHLYSTLPALNISYNFNVTGVKPEQNIDGVSRQNIFLIFKEAITNVIKHSNATHVEVSIKNADHYFEMVIRDNGTAINTRFAGNSMGLSSMRNRAAKMGGELRINTLNGYEVLLSGKGML